MHTGNSNFGGDQRRWWGHSWRGEPEPDAKRGLVLMSLCWLGAPEQTDTPGASLRPCERGTHLLCPSPRVAQLQGKGACSCCHVPVVISGKSQSFSTVDGLRGWSTGRAWCLATECVPMPFVLWVPPGFEASGKPGVLPSLSDHVACVLWCTLMG